MPVRIKYMNGCTKACKLTYVNELESLINLNNCISSSLNSPTVRKRGRPCSTSYSAIFISSFQTSQFTDSIRTWSGRLKIQWQMATRFCPVHHYIRLEETFYGCVTPIGRVTVAGCSPLFHCNHMLTIYQVGWVYTVNRAHFVPLKTFSKKYLA